MKIIKAIYLPDLAHSSKESFTFEYNKGTKRFYMASDDIIEYDLIFLVEDDNWYIFETELITEDKVEGQVSNVYGETKRILNTDLEEYLKKYNILVKE